MFRTRSKHTLQSHPLVRISKHMRIVFAWRTTKKSKERCKTSEILSTRLMLTLSILPLSISCSQSLAPHSRNNILAVPCFSFSAHTQTHVNIRARTRSSQFRFVLFLVCHRQPRSVSLTALRTITVSTELNVSLATTYYDGAYLIQSYKIRLRQRFRSTKNKYFPFDNLLNTFALVWLRFATLQTV